MEKALGKIFNFSVYSIIFFLPLFFLPFTFEAFEYNKLYLLLFLSFIGLSARLARQVFYKKEINIKITSLDLGVLIFLSAGLISLVFSVNKFNSIFGSYARFSNGLIALTSFIIFYFLFSNFLKTEPVAKNKSLNILAWSCACVILFSYLSVFQVFAKIGFLPAIMKQAGFNPVGRSLQILAVFISLIAVFFCARLMERALDKNSKRQEKILQAFLIIACVILLFLINFKPAWLIMLVAMVFFTALSAKKGVFRQNVNLLLLPIFFVVLSAFFLSPASNGFLRMARPAYIASLPVEKTLPQIASWQISLGALKNGMGQALTGTGIGTFGYDFAKFKPLNINKDQIFWAVRSDRSGNLFAEILGTMGILGLLAYTELIALFYIIFSKKLKNAGALTPFSASLAAVFFALCAGQAVFYQNMALAFLFWFFLAFGKNEFDEPVFEKNILLGKTPEAGLLANTILAVLGASVLIFAYFQIAFWQADANFLAGANAGEIQKRISYIEKAVSINTDNTSYMRFLAQAYWEDISNDIKSGDKEKLANIKPKIERQISLLEGITTIRPLEVENWEAKSFFYKEMSPYVAGLQEKAILSLNEAIKLEPNNPIFYSELGKIYLALQNADEAGKNFDKAIALKSDYADVMTQKAIMLEQQGKNDEAIAMAELALQTNPYNNIDGVYQLGRLYYNAGKIDQAIAQFSAIVEIMPNHSNALYSLGLAYSKKGDKTLALRFFEKVLSLNPGNPDVKQKIIQLRGQ